MSIWVTGSLEVRDSSDNIVLRVGDSANAEGAVSPTAKVLTASADDGYGGLLIIRDDASIVANDSLGAVTFAGNDGGPGAVPNASVRLTAEASSTWASNYQQGTNVRFFVQDNTSGVNKMDDPYYAVFMVSGSNDLTTEFGVPVNIAGPAYAKDSLQVGVSQNGGADPVNYSQGYIFRVSNDADTNAGIEIDADGTGISSIFFNRDGQATSQNFGMGIFVDHSDTNNRFSIRRYATDQSQGAITVHGNGNSVRIAGGPMASNTVDAAASLVVSSSASNRNPHVLVRSRFATQTTDNQPTITLDFEDGTATGTNNAGTWHFTVGSEWARTTTSRPLIIGAEGVSNSNFSREPAITIAEGGTHASVGIGGRDNGFSRSSLAQIFPRSMNPTGSLHVEKERSAADALTQDLDGADIFIGNSDDGHASGDRIYTKIAFDPTRDYNKEKHTASITVVRDYLAEDNTAHEGYFHLRMYDASGNIDSTRTRMRVDHQGAVLLTSGTSPSAGGSGWPGVQDNQWNVEEVPSGSLTLISNTATVSPPTLSFTTWPATTMTANKDISAGNELGRIQWYSSDKDLSGADERTGAYIEAVASENHTSANKSPMNMDFYVRESGAPSPERKMSLTGSFIQMKHRRERIQFGFQIGKNDAATSAQAMLFFPNSTTESVVPKFSTVDQHPEQISHAWISPFSARVGKIYVVMDHSWGDEALGEAHEVKILREPAGNRTNLATIAATPLSSGQRVDYRLFYGTDGANTAAGTVVTASPQDDQYFFIAPGDKLYVGFQGYADDTEWIDSAGSSLGGGVVGTIWLELFMDDFNNI